MPGASDRVADEDPFRERSSVVRARRSDREDLLSAARKERGLAPDVAEEHASVRDLRDRHARAQVGTARGLLFCSHYTLGHASKVPRTLLQSSITARLDKAVEYWP